MFAIGTYRLTKSESFSQEGNQASFHVPAVVQSVALTLVVGSMRKHEVQRPCKRLQTACLVYIKYTTSVLCRREWRLMCCFVGLLLELKHTMNLEKFPGRGKLIHGNTSQRTLEQDIRMQTYNGTFEWWPCLFLALCLMEWNQWRWWSPSSFPVQLTNTWTGTRKPDTSLCSFIGHTLKAPPILLLSSYSKNTTIWVLVKSCD